MTAEPDPERDVVVIRREHLGILLGASLAMLAHLTKDRPSHERTWQLATACSAAELALLAEDTEKPALQVEGGLREEWS